MIYGGHPNSLTDLAETVRRTVDAMRPRCAEFDSIAVRGMSGVLVGSPVALALGKPLVVIRKPGDSNHAGVKPIGWADAGERYVFLDDFISLGNTRREVQEQMAQYTEAAYGGSYLYGSTYEDKPIGWGDVQ